MLSSGSQLTANENLSDLDRIDWSRYILPLDPFPYSSYETYLVQVCNPILEDISNAQKQQRVMNMKKSMQEHLLPASGPTSSKATVTSNLHHAHIEEATLSDWETTLDEAMEILSKLGLFSGIIPSAEEQDRAMTEAKQIQQADLEHTQYFQNARDLQCARNQETPMKRFTTPKVNAPHSVLGPFTPLSVRLGFEEKASENGSDESSWNDTQSPFIRFRLRRELQRRYDILQEETKKHQNNNKVDLNRMLLQSPQLNRSEIALSNAGKRIEQEIHWRCQLPMGGKILQSKLFAFAQLSWKVTLGVNHHLQACYYLFLSPAENLKSECRVTCTFKLLPKNMPFLHHEQRSNQAACRVEKMTFVFPADKIISQGFDDFLANHDLANFLTSDGFLQLLIIMSSKLGKNGELVG